MSWSTQRLPEELQTTEFARQIDRLRRELGGGLIDMTESNPTRGFPAHRRRLAEHLKAAAARLGETAYEPTPKGLLMAREAVADYYGSRGRSVPPRQICLTASTSEAYGWLGKLLADPGGEVLVPTPSYPLFDHLFRAECLEAVPYRYRYDGAWHLDVGHLREGIESCERPAAIVSVSPNNPTGHRLESGEFEALAELSRWHDLPLIVDEVFLDYGHRSEDAASVLGEVERASLPERPLTFVLSGLSKVAAAPGAKLAWIAVDGPPRLRGEALERLEFLADSYLSVSTVTQLATPDILGAIPPFQRGLRRRLASNLESLDSALEAVPSCERYPVDAGWYAVVRMPSFIDEERFVLELLEEPGVAVEPGFFYDLEPAGHLVVSLLTAPEAFGEGAVRLCETLARRINSA